MSLSLFAGSSKSFLENADIMTVSQLPSTIRKLELKSPIGGSIRVWEGIYLYRSHIGPLRLL
jgi:hypothetical protein